MAHIDAIYTLYTIRYDTVRYDAMRCDNYMSISISGVHFDIELLFHGSCCFSRRCCCYCYNSWLILFTNFVVPLLPVQFLLSLWLWLLLFICFSFSFFCFYVFYAFFSFTLFYVFLYLFLFFVCFFLFHTRAQKVGQRKGGGHLLVSHLRANFSCNIDIY